MTAKFFEERSEASEIKAKIVSQYFDAWAKVIAPTALRRGGKIAYIDLYAGPGRYKDGAASTPLLVLEKAIANKTVADLLVTYFNDASSENTSTLQDEINALSGIETLKFKPVVSCSSIDDTDAGYFADVKMIPAFSFIDPFGYKGLSSKIIKGVIKDWGCDCIFFFNYARINAGIGNSFVDEHMNNLFGNERASILRRNLIGLTPIKREALILETLASEIKSLGGTFVLPFTFKNEAGTRTTHKLVFVTKHFRGYEIMKSIMASQSSTNDEGVASFTYSPADASTPLLFSLTQPFSAMLSRLPRDYAGQTMSRKQLYEKDSVDRPFLEKHYTEALKHLEHQGLISVMSDSPNRRSGTFPDHVQVKFGI